MSFRVSPFQNATSQQDCLLNERLIDSSQRSSFHSMEPHHLRASAQTLANKVFESLGLTREVEWPALEAFFYKFIEYHGITCEEVEDLTKNSSIKNGAWLTLCEELKESTRLITGVGRFFKHPPAGINAFWALITYTLFHPVKRRNDSELTSRLTQLFDRREGHLDLVTTFDCRLFLFTLIGSYFRSFELSFLDSIDECEGLVRFVDTLDPKLSDINKEEGSFYERKAQRVIDLLPPKNPGYLLKSFQKDRLFYERIQQTTAVLFAKTKYAEPIIKEILAIADQVEVSLESRKLLLWLLDITEAYPFSQSFEDPRFSLQVEPVLLTLQSLQETLSSFSPKSLEITVEIYGQFLFSSKTILEQKVDTLDHYKKLTSFFTIFCRLVQTCAPSEEEKQIHRALCSLMSRFHEEQVEQTMFDSFFKELFTWCTALRARQLTSLTLKLALALGKGVHDCNIMKELLGCL
ncbi:MAG: hypothetical protein K2X08_02590, partial [Chlamydiales bacterium]|nr:hypothetical protein [Chlamydiales bacterium]